jgi:hypothetical protein
MQALGSLPGFTVVARTVFAASKITFHRIVGAVIQ